MGRSGLKAKCLNFLRLLSGILPMIFWGLVLFSFEEYFLAWSTIFCAVIHESGHIIAIILTSDTAFSLRGVINGFRIKTEKIKSYDEEALIYLCGPIANLVAFAICFILSRFYDVAFAAIGTINLLTALSNLMPINGYDGYGFISAMIKKYELPSCALKLISAFSSAMIFCFCLFSLYLIDRYAEGYWIFAVFFVAMVKEIDAGLKERF